VEGLFGWSDLLAATAHSPGHHEYFDQHSSYHSNPATPPMDPGVSPLAQQFTRLHPSGHQQTSSDISWGEIGQAAEQGHSNHIGSAFGQMQMDVGTSRHGGAYYHGQGHILRESRQMRTFRSISPAPSSPGGSIDGSEANTRMQDSRGFTTSMVSHSQQGGAEGLAHQPRASPTQEKRALGGRMQFVMGFRPDCERCQRREKGHFAHFS
jgi:hypothetical protein